MIDDLDETIKQLLIKEGPLEPSIDVSFNIPDREWSASISNPTINLYLYDIRENHNLRSTEWTVEKNGNSATRRKNANRINLSYLVTVWTDNVADQHRLLWRVLITLFRYPTLPQELLTGKLAEQNYTIVTSAAQPDGLLNNQPGFWTALDNNIKPFINYVVTLPMDLSIAFTSSVARTTVLGVKPPHGDSEQLIQISGIVHVAGEPTQGATVLAKEAGMTATTDIGGKYIFSRIPPGRHTFQVFVGGKKLKESKVTVPGQDYNLEV